MKKTLIKILGLAMAVAACATVASVDVKAETKYSHAEGCTAEGFWYDDTETEGIHICICEKCSQIVAIHTPDVGDEYVKYNSEYHTKKCTVDGCGVIYTLNTKEKHNYVDDICTVCGYWGPHHGYNIKKYEERVGRVERVEMVRNGVDPSAQAFGGRKPEQLTLEEQKTSVSYCYDQLVASGNALPKNTVQVGGGTNGNAANVAAVVADNKDAANQQMFAQAMCQNLGYKNVTPLKTYNMYALNSSYDVKNNKQTIFWNNTGLKAGDSAFVVWYNQKLGKIELLPAVVGANGSVAVSVPAIGDCSTMTVVKANK